MDQWMSELYICVKLQIMQSWKRFEAKASEILLYHINYPFPVTNVSPYLICREFKGEIEKVWNSNGTICHVFFFSCNFFLSQDCGISSL